MVSSCRSSAVQLSVDRVLAAGIKLAAIPASPLEASKVESMFGHPIPKAQQVARTAQKKVKTTALALRPTVEKASPTSTALVRAASDRVKGVVSSGKAGRWAGGVSALSAVPEVAAQSARNYDKIMAGFKSGRRRQ